MNENERNMEENERNGKENERNIEGKQKKKGNKCKETEEYEETCMEMKEKWKENEGK